MTRMEGTRLFKKYSSLSQPDRLKLLARLPDADITELSSAGQHYRHMRMLFFEGPGSAVARQRVQQSRELRALIDLKLLAIGVAANVRAGCVVTLTPALRDLDKEERLLRAALDTIDTSAIPR